MKMHHYIVVLAGGKGERLWPLSRNKQPKQLLPFIDEKSLLEHTLERIKNVVPSTHIWTLTTQEQQAQINKTVGAITGRCLIEPAGRNTAPAILFACKSILETNPQATILFLPADHFIPDTALFCTALEKMFAYCDKNPHIALLGIKPTYAATGYGYIKACETPNAFKNVEAFIEKPDSEHAQQYLALKNMFWNAGIFCAQGATFIKEFARCAPDLTHQFDRYMNGIIDYNDLENISIDYAVLEKSDAVVVLPVDFEWSDVGNLATFLSLIQTEHEASNQTLIEIDSANNLVKNSTHKLTVLIGMHNICIVETDDVLLIAKKEDVEKVKLALKTIKKNNLHSYI